VEVEAFLADAVQAVGGKLYGLGLGWRVLTAKGFPARHDRVGVAVLLRMVAAEAEGEHRLTVRLLDGAGAPRPLGRGSGGSELMELDAPFAVHATGDEASATFALNFDGLVFEEAGTYTFVLAVDGQERKRVGFRVQSLPAPPAADYRGGGYL
jgi:hypothetical protein